MDPVSPLSAAARRCSIIGSFRKHYDLVCKVAEVFEDAGVQVLSPRISTVMDPQEWFVMLETDDQSASPAEVQAIALHRILRSDFVFVVVVDRYIGTTTAYEVGRVLERRVPIYFSEQPHDIPISFPSGCIQAAEEIAQHVAVYSEPPPILSTSLPSRLRDLEEGLFDPSDQRFL